MQRRIRHISVVLLSLVAIFLIQSCTVHKRVHRRGWYIQWNHIKSENYDPKETHRSNTEIETDAEDSMVQKPLIFSEPTADPISTDLPIKSNSRQSQKKNVSRSNQQNPLMDLKQNHSSEEVQYTIDKTTGKGVNSKSNKKRQPRSPRLPILAVVLLVLGILLTVLGLFILFLFAVLNSTTIGVPVYVMLIIVAGIGLLAFAVSVAMAPFNYQPSPHEPRYKKEPSRQEKKERKPLKKGDKIFLAIIGGILVGTLLLILFT